MLAEGDAGARLHPARSERRRGDALGSARRDRRPLLLSPRRHAGLHDPGLRHPRPPRRVRRGRRAGDRGLARRGRRRSKKFAGKYDLDFTLLADPDHAVADAYGAWGEKSMYGKKYMGMLRSTFIIDPDGKIARVFPKVQPKKHDDLVLKALGELAAA